VLTRMLSSPNTFSICALSYLIIGYSIALVIENEDLLNIPADDSYKLLPSKISGSFARREPTEDAVCRQCQLDAGLFLDRVKQKKYFDYFSRNDSVTNWFQLAGIKTCSEGDIMTECFKNCLSLLSEEEKTELSNAHVYKQLNAMMSLYCERRYRPGDASCRFADTARCSKYNRNMCGEELEMYYKCVEDTLALTGQDCTGHCTPARRWYMSDKFKWQMECSLRATYKDSCTTIVQHLCFSPVKSTDISYGIFYDMDKDPEMANNLTHTCQVFESPYDCVHQATYWFYDYFGFNVSYACGGAENVTAQIVSDWADIISPFCGDNVPETSQTLEDVCPTPDANNPPPEVYRYVSTTTTTTTERTWEFYEPKAGRCPATLTGDSAGCEMKICGDDSHCDGDMKCCTGCCKQPLIRTTTTSVPGSPAPGPRGGKRKPRPRASSGHDTNANNQRAAASNKTDIVKPLYNVALYALSIILLTYGFSV